MKRFYKDVTVAHADGRFAILLDGRPVRTPARAALAVASEPLAQAMADEWRAQGDVIDPRSMPMTGLANAAIDRVAPDPASFAATLAPFAETDLLCYRATDPVELVARQAAIWDPILDWARTRYDVHFTIAEGIVHRPQPPATIARLAEALATREPYPLAALALIITIGGSLVIALAVAEGALDPAAAFDAAHLDEFWQIEQWGDDPLGIDARAARRADFLAAARFLTLV